MLTFGYGVQVLLYEVSLQIHTGEMVGLLGPNGSGKTTLLRLLSGVLNPQQGQVTLDGRDLHSWGRVGVARRMAVVPQELHIPYAFTVEHMVGLGRTPFIKTFFGAHTREDAAIVQEAMELAGVTALAARVFNELSGGERQRVMIAMALAQQPAMLLLDEPTAHLDVKHQIETLELVQQLNRERGVSVIAAIHDLNLAARYFPRLILFQRGIVADAAPTAVLEPGLLSRVYGVNVHVGILRGSEHISVSPPGTDSNVSETSATSYPRVHVMAGGGSGELLMRALADAHIPFIAGALNVGDSDHTLALRLATTVITEQPYAPIATSTLAEVQASLAQVDLLVICPIPIGPGNLPLLQQALDAAQRGVFVVLLTSSGVRGACDPTEAQATDDGLLERSGMAARDYTGGVGIALLQQLLQAGALLANSIGEVLDVARQRINATV